MTTEIFIIQFPGMPTSRESLRVAEQKLAECLRGGQDHIAIDLSLVRMLESSYLGFLSRWVRNFTSVGGKVYLIGILTGMRELMALGGLKDLCPMLDSLNELREIEPNSEFSYETKILKQQMLVKQTVASSETDLVDAKLESPQWSNAPAATPGFIRNLPIRVDGEEPTTEFRALPESFPNQSQPDWGMVGTKRFDPGIFPESSDTIVGETNINETDTRESNCIDDPQAPEALALSGILDQQAANNSTGDIIGEPFSEPTTESALDQETVSLFSEDPFGDGEVGNPGDFNTEARVQVNLENFMADAVKNELEESTQESQIGIQEENQQEIVSQDIHSQSQNSLDDNYPEEVVAEVELPSDTQEMVGTFPISNSGESEFDAEIESGHEPFFQSDTKSFKAYASLGNGMENEESEADVEILTEEEYDETLAKGIRNEVEMTGEYQCLGCGETEMFLKGFRFDPCLNEKCEGSEDGWYPTFELF